MFFRQRKADWVTDLLWDWNERVESMITIRLQASGDGERVDPSMAMNRSLTSLSSAL